MYELCLTGKIELESPEGFVDAFQKLLNEYKTSFRGQSSLIKLPDYVDYQKVEEDPPGSV